MTTQAISSSSISPLSSLRSIPNTPKTIVLTRSPNSAFTPVQPNPGTTRSTSTIALQTLDISNHFNVPGKPWSLAAQMGVSSLAPPSSGHGTRRVAPSMQGFSDSAIYKETPSCPRISRRECAPHEFKPVFQNLQAGVEFEIDGPKNEKMKLKPVEVLGIGTFSKAWKVLSSPNRIYVYKPDESPNFSRVKQELYLYGVLKNADFPVARYVDLDPFLEDESFQDIIRMPKKSERDEALLQFVRTNVNHGYHLRQYMHKFFPTFEEAQKLEEKEKTFLYGILKDMLEYAYKTKLPINLSRNKIGIYSYKKREPDNTFTYHSEVLYTGLMSSDEDLDSLQEGAIISVENPFELIRKQCLRSFAPEGSDLYKFLDPAPKDLSLAE